MRRWMVVAVLAACGGDPERECSVTRLPGDDGDNILVLDDEDAEVPAPTPPEQELLRDALHTCSLVLGEAQADIAPRCTQTVDHASALATALQEYAIALRGEPDLPGLDRAAQLEASITETGPLAVRLCSNNPAYTTSSTAMNAFAMRDLVVMQSPLLDAIAEGAAHWDVLREQAGGDEMLIDRDQLLTGLLQIFYPRLTGTGAWTVVSKPEAMSRVTSSAFAREIYQGGVSFVLFHELGHANLKHSTLQHLVVTGLARILAEMGVTLSAAERAELEAALVRLQVGVEAQADIYGNTLLRKAGHGTRGPAVLFAGLVLGVGGICVDEGVQDEAALEACVEAKLGKTHPPIAVRSTILRHITRDGEDWTCLLDPEALTLE